MKTKCIHCNKSFPFYPWMAVLVLGQTLICPYCRKPQVKFPKIKRQK